MRILLVNKFLYPAGGSETYMFQLADSLRANGHEVQFFGMSDQRNVVDVDERRLVRNLRFHGFSLAALGYPLRIVYSVEARRKIRWFLETFKPDIVHLGIFNFQLTPSIIYEIRRHGVPIVHTVHDAAMICPAHLLYNASTGRVCERCAGGHYLSCLTTSCIHGSIIKSAIGAFEARLYRMLGTYELIDSVICPSQFYADKLVQFGVKTGQILVMPNAVDLHPEKSSGKEGGYVLYFGRLIKEKGIETLLKACSALPEVPFVIAGQGPLAEGLENYPNVRYVGFRQGGELRKLIEESLFTVCPSEWYENCPMSVLESMALGTPVVAAKIGGIPELIADGSDGYLFPPGDASALVHRILELYNDHERLAQFSSRLGAKMRRYSVGHYYDQLLEVYEAAIAVRKCQQ